MDSLLVRHFSAAQLGNFCFRRLSELFRLRHSRTFSKMELRERQEAEKKKKRGPAIEDPDIIISNVCYDSVPYETIYSLCPFNNPHGLRYESY